MTGPKHLWSGDWENESASAPDGTARRRPEPDAAPGRSPEGTERGGPQRRRRRTALTAVVVILAVAGVTVAAVASNGSHAKHATTPSTEASAPPTQRTLPNLTTPTIPTNPTTPTNPASPTNPTTTPVVSRPVSWLGMEVITAQPGAAVVDTVKPSSPADQAGLTPGDVILSIDGHDLQGASGIASIVRGDRSGQTLHLEVARGGSIIDLQATYAGPPSNYP